LVSAEPCSSSSSTAGWSPTAIPTSAPARPWSRRRRKH